MTILVTGATGTDGVEVHGATGYLVHQFLAPDANQRNDDYGGSMEHRARFAIDFVRAIAKAIGPEKTAIRFSPGFPTGGIAEGQSNDDLYRHLSVEFGQMGLAYLHILHAGNESLLADIRQRFGGVLVVNRQAASLSKWVPTWPRALPTWGLWASWRWPIPTSSRA